jgi:hypothetical protein
MGVAVGIGATGVIVNFDAGINVFVAIAVFAGGANVFAGGAACVAQAVNNRAIFTKTNKVFFISKLLTY